MNLDRYETRGFYEAHICDWYWVRGFKYESKALIYVAGWHYERSRSW